MSGIIPYNFTDTSYYLEDRNTAHTTRISTRPRADGTWLAWVDDNPTMAAEGATQSLAIAALMERIIMAQMEPPQKPA